MKNYLSKHYKHYYIQATDGQSIEVTRAECIAPSESQTTENPYKQRWFYDGEQYSYIIRLPRNEQSESLYRMNAAYIKAEERYQSNKFACVLNNTGECDNDCQNCQRKKFPRTVELDKPLAGNGENDDEPQYFEIAARDDYAEFEDNAVLDDALSKLLPQQRELIEKIFCEGYSAQDIADLQGIDKSAISHRLKRAYKKLKTFLA